VYALYNEAVQMTLAAWWMKARMKETCLFMLCFETNISIMVRQEEIE
jgi:hypothetical protein